MGAIIMRIDFATFAFGYKVIAGGNTPNWSTALGQGATHKINESPAINELLKGLIYKSVSPEKISLKLGKGGREVFGNSEDSPIVLGSVFSKVYINDRQIDDAKFIIILTRDAAGSHAGRLKIKYGISNAFHSGDQTYTNADFISAMKEQLCLAEDACWFVSDISVRNQDELVLKTVIVNKDGCEEYPTGQALHSAWDELEATEFPEDYPEEIKTGENIILYGVPGCGKSFTIKDEYCDDEKYMERVVFHPDYSYADFVGQILPQSYEDADGKSHISYPFKPGPFTKILKEAYGDKGHNYYLIIEEINRGNAPAIFGEIFQLLDRRDGVSDYGINNYDIASEVYGDPDHLIRLPKNLFILATMNTADQNVFTLDTAFKRRWKMVSIENDLAKCKHADATICGTTVSWRQFAEIVNEKIIEFGRDNLSSEDNRLGAYFVKADDLSDESIFSEKVLMYLWNDAFKYNKEDVFNHAYRTLEELIDGFKKVKFAVFDSSFGFPSIEEMALEKKEMEDEEYLTGKPEWHINIYNSIKQALDGQVEDMYTYTTGSKQYIGVGSNKNKKRSFADISFQREQVVVSIEKPTKEDLLAVGSEIPYDGHHNHYFKVIITSETALEDVISAILNSYEQLKKED